MWFWHFAGSLARAIEWIGVVGMWFILGITVFDVAGAKLFLSPLPAAIELIAFAQTAAIASAIASGLFLGRHIRVEFFINRFPKPTQVIINTIASLLGLIFFAILAWQSSVYGFSLKKAGEISSTAHIPLYPFAHLLAACAAVASLFFLGEIIVQFRRGVQNEPD